MFIAELQTTVGTNSCGYRAHVDGCRASQKCPRHEIILTYRHGIHIGYPLFYPSSSPVIALCENWTTATQNLATL